MLNSKNIVGIDDKTLEQYLKRIHKKALKSGIDREIWQENYKTLLSGLEGGWGKPFAGITYNQPDWYYIAELKYNTASFAAFKNHQETGKLTELLVDENGRPRKWEDFRDKALKISKKYNKRHLQVEHNHAAQSTRMASKWKGFEADADLYPNLEYVAVMDERTRESHAALNGAIYPINHSFWNTHYPPNDWGCRCNVRQSDEPPNEKPGIDLPENFRNNPGKTARVFDETHPYVANANKADKKYIMELVHSYIRHPKDILGSNRNFLKYGKDWEKAYFDWNTGGYNVYHKGHMFDPNRGYLEKDAGKILARKGKQLEFLDESGTGRHLDTRFDGLKWELKGIEANTSSSIVRDIYKARKQGAERLILYFPKMPDKSIIRKGIKRFKGQASAHKYNSWPATYTMDKNGTMKLILEQKKKAD